MSSAQSTSWAIFSPAISAQMDEESVTELDTGKSECQARPSAPHGVPAVSRNREGTPVTGVSTDAEGYEGVDSERVKVAHDLLPHVVVGMPVKTFLNKFLWVPGADLEEFDDDIFRKLPFPGTQKYKGKKYDETDLYGPLIKAIANMLGEQFLVVDTHKYSDKAAAGNKKWQPDITVYCVGDTGNVDLENPMNFSIAEILHEVKPKDPFEDCKGKSVRDRRDLNTLSPIEDIIGQTGLCFIELFSRQHRTHAFYVLFTAKIARFIRADRVGYLVTEAVDFREDASLVAEFYWRYSQTTLEVRGFDTTARRATDEEILLARPLLAPWAHKDKLERPFYAFDVPNTVPITPKSAPSSLNKVVSEGAEVEDRAQNVADKQDRADSPRTVVGWAPLSELRSLTGRATRSYAVVDIATKEILLLKDTWRIDIAEIELEADILWELNNLSVPHIPKVVGGGDLIGKYQTTKTQEYSNSRWRTGQKSPIVGHVHHRLLMKLKPRRILDADTPRAMMTSVFHAILAHQGAYEIGGFLHRDITIDSVLIHGDSEGMLIHWDQAIRVAIIKGRERQVLERLEARQPLRPVCWAFASAAVEENPQKIHLLEDDLESFLWVVTFISLCCMEYTTAAEHAPTFPDIRHNFFNQRRLTSNPEGAGSAKKYVLTQTGVSMLHGLKFLHNEPITDWFYQMRDVFWDLNLYTAQQHHSTHRRGLPSAFNKLEFPKELESHDYIISLTRSSIEAGGWPEGMIDNGIAVKVKKDKGKSKVSKAKSQKRTNEDDDEYPHKRKRSSSDKHALAAASTPKSSVISASGRRRLQPGTKRGNKSKP